MIVLTSRISFSERKINSRSGAIADSFNVSVWALADLKIGGGSREGLYIMLSLAFVASPRSSFRGEGKECAQCIERLIEVR